MPAARENFASFQAGTPALIQLHYDPPSRHLSHDRFDVSDHVHRANAPNAGMVIALIRHDTVCLTLASHQGSGPV
jgi:hypothetical protein